MRYKANFHTHTNEDPRDFVNYSIYECINIASLLGFEVIALTCHDKFINKIEYTKYAENKGILLIPGIEKTIQKRHIIILGCDADIENTRTFDELHEYKKFNPEIFIIAPHPCFPGNYSLKENEIESNKNLFDAIEYSWFYTKHINYSKKGEVIAKSLGIPVIATSDTHDLQFLNSSYATVEAKEKQSSDIFESIRRGNFQNFSEPQKLCKAMCFFAKSKLDTIFRASAKNEN